MRARFNGEQLKKSCHPTAVLYVNTRQKPIRARRVSARKNEGSIPAYSSSGQRLRNYSLAAVERFLAIKPPACVAKHNRRTGRVCSIQFFPLPESSSACREAKQKILATAHMGQAYSFKECVDNAGHRVWKHSQTLMPRSEDADTYLRLIFRAVPLSCLVQQTDASEAPVVLVEEPLPEPPSPPANVVTMRSKRTRVLVVEDDMPYLKAA